jgi:hypothetical protein
MAPSCLRLGDAGRQWTRRDVVEPLLVPRVQSHDRWPASCSPGPTDRGPHFGRPWSCLSLCWLVSATTSRSAGLPLSQGRMAHRMLNQSVQREGKAMAKKSTMSKAADAVKTVAGTALGAAAAAATQVVVDAVAKGGAKLDAAGPELQKSAADAVSKPILPSPKRKSARAKVKAPVRKPSELRLWPKRKEQPKRNIVKRPAAYSWGVGVTVPFLPDAKATRSSNA